MGIRTFIEKLIGLFTVPRCPNCGARLEEVPPTRICYSTKNIIDALYGIEVDNKLLTFLENNE